MLSVTGAGGEGGNAGSDEEVWAGSYNKTPRHSIAGPSY